ncbi:MAG: helix-hairpin-helix domain-containing protein [Selenomonadaceae bacterium]|nr:helix-hairpin-helix domain-containing protein [Selenomonadaceae bacterium]
MPMFKRSMIILLVIAAAALGMNYHLNDDDNYIKLDAATSKSKSHSEEQPKEIIYVYVTGAVNKPGMVELEGIEGSLRVDDAINACGGLLPTADIENFNGAEKIEDGQHIRIPEKKIDPKKENSSNENANDNKKAASTNGDVVNINTADVNELATLKGIGPKTAERIIEYRKNNGSFKSIEEIKNVKGIGDKKFENIKDRLRI